MQHANCSRVLKESFLDHKVNNPNHEMRKWIEEKATFFLQFLSTVPPSPPSNANSPCNFPTCTRI